MALIECPECNKQISETASSCPQCGYSFSKGETESILKESKKYKIAGYFVSAIILIFLFKLCTGGDKSKVVVPWDQVDNSLVAWVYTRSIVEKQLKSPITAKFPADYTEFIKHNGTTYTIDAYVDSQNSFGAMIRTYFKATVQEVSEDRWMTVSINFIDNN